MRTFIDTAKALRENIYLFSDSKPRRKQLMYKFLEFYLKQEKEF